MIRILTMITGYTKLDGDDTNKDHNGPIANPKAKAGFLNRLLFMWIFPTILTGWRKGNLDSTDVYPVMEEDKAGIVVDRLERTYARAKLDKSSCSSLKTPNAGNMLFKCLTRAFFWEMLWPALAFGFVAGILKSVQRVTLGMFVNYFSSGGMDYSEDMAYFLGLATAVNFSIGTWIKTASLISMHWNSMRMKVALEALVFRKILRLQSSVLKQNPIGNLVNMLSTDATKVEQMGDIHYIWLGIVNFIVSLLIAIKLFGIHAIISMGVFCLFIPYQVIMGRLTLKIRKTTASFTDARIAILHDVLTGIKIIKMYVWEDQYWNRINQVRRKEIFESQKGATIKIWNYIMHELCAKVALLMLLALLVMSEKELNVGNLFIAYGLFNNLKLTCIKLMPMGILQLSDGLVAVKRMQDFLELEEFPKSESCDKIGFEQKSTNQEPKIMMNSYSAKWNAFDEIRVLDTINFKLERKKLHVLVGPVGSGKSSLLHAIMGEMKAEEGSAKVTGIISYASQDHWIFPGTVKENVLFNSAFEVVRYQKVLRVCGLEHDLKQWKEGEDTLVGERGIKLSGGQKARINLARAIYKKADIYLLDDPLSSVDIKIGKEIFRKCIQRFLTDKLVLLVTHQTHLIDNIEKANIYMMNDAKLIKIKSSELAEGEALELSRNINDNNIMKKKSKLVTDSPKNQVEDNNCNGLQYFGNNSMWKTIFMYLDTCDISYMCLVILVIVMMNQIAIISYEIVFLQWMNNVDYYEDKALNKEGVDSNMLSNNEWLENLSISAMFCLVTLLLQSFHFKKASYKSSEKLHDKMFLRVIYASMRFFEQSPSGMVLNNFSKDIGMVDEVLLPSVLTFLDFLQVLIILILITYVDYFLHLAILPALLVCAAVCTVSLPSTKSLSGLEGQKRAPVLLHLTSTMQGLVTIRVHKQEKHMERRFNELQDNHTSVYYAKLACTGFMCIWSELLFSAVWYFFCWYFIYKKSTYFGHGGDVGTVLNWTTYLVFTFTLGVRNYAQLEFCISSIQRLLAYKQLETEQELVATCTNNHNDVPTLFTKGHLELQDVTMSYSPNGPLVLKGISFVCKPGEKIGIAGRTGAGKSTLLSVLFRLCEFDGQVLIDGQTTKDMDLKQLRKNLATIPQDPLIFDGSIRKNIDPLDKFSDDKIWDALDKVQLKSFVQSHASGLDYVLNSGGSNISVGQRQLICLARVIMEQKKILVMDEATANVDPVTEETIKTILKTHLSECTVLTVAHRLNTILDSDRIIVMSNGRIQEIGQPSDLLSDPSSALNQLMDSPDEI